MKTTKALNGVNGFTEDIWLGNVKHGLSMEEGWEVYGKGKNDNNWL